MKIIWAMTVGGLLLTAGCKKDGAVHEKEPAAAEKPKEKADENLVTLTPELIVSAKIQTVEVKRDTSFVTTRFTGRIEMNPNAFAVAQPLLESRLNEWLVQVGDHVKKGDVLAHLESPQNLGVTAPLKAPMEGEVIERSTLVGDWIKPGDKTLVIADLSTLRAIAEVREDLVGKILTDAPATIRTTTFAGETFSGKFLRTTSQVNPETRTLDFLYDLPNPDRKFRAGMFVQFSLATDKVTNQLIVPEAAMQFVRGHSVVFVEEETGKYRATPVRLGRTLGEANEVLEGLSDGAHVVTAGSFILKTELLKSEIEEKE